MKLVLALIFSFGVVAFADDFGGDPNMEIGLNNGTTEASFNDTTKAHQNSQKAQGKTDVANCPYCATHTPLALAQEPNTTVYLENGKVVSEAPEGVAKSNTPGVDPADSHQ